MDFICQGVERLNQGLCEVLNIHSCDENVCGASEPDRTLKLGDRFRWVGWMMEGLNCKLGVQEPIRAPKRLGELVGTFSLARPLNRCISLDQWILSCPRVHYLGIGFGDRVRISWDPLSSQRTPLPCMYQAQMEGTMSAAIRSLQCVSFCPTRYTAICTQLLLCT